MSVYDVFETIIGELKAISSQTKKSKTTQIRSSSERDLLKAFSLAWFKSHRPKLVTLGCDIDVIKAMDENYTFLSDAKDKSLSRVKVSVILKNLKKEILKAQKESLTNINSTHKLHQQMPSFANLVHNTKMQAILERRWKETEQCLKIGASLAATVMMGGILESLLLAKINQFQNNGALFKCKSVPIDKKTRKKLELSKWTLNVYIEVAHEMNWISGAAKSVGVALRDYRNFIHPQKEFSHNIEISPEDAKVFWDVVSSISRELL